MQFETLLINHLSYHTNSCISKHFNNTNSLFQNKVQVNTIPYISWSKAHPIHHALREQSINTHHDISSSKLNLLGSCQPTRYVNKNFRIYRRTYCNECQICVIMFNFWNVTRALQTALPNFASCSTVSMLQELYLLTSCPTFVT